MSIFYDGNYYTTSISCICHIQHEKQRYILNLGTFYGLNKNVYQEVKIDDIFNSLFIIVQKNILLIHHVLLNNTFYKSNSSFSPSC